MFWLVHIHSERSFLGTYFSMSLDFKSRVVNFDGKEFAIMRWMGPNKQFIEKWKRGNAPPEAALIWDEMAVQAELFSGGQFEIFARRSGRKKGMRMMGRKRAAAPTPETAARAALHV